MHVLFEKLPIGLQIFSTVVKINYKLSKLTKGNRTLPEKKIALTDRAKKNTRGCPVQSDVHRHI